LDLDTCLQTKLLIVDVFDGPIRRYNELHFDKVIIPADMIESVNGVENSARAMAEALRTSNQVLARIRKSWCKEEDAQIDAYASESSMHHEDPWQATKVQNTGSSKSPLWEASGSAPSLPSDVSRNPPAVASFFTSHQQVSSPVVSHRQVMPTGKAYSASVAPGILRQVSSVAPVAHRQVSSPFASPSMSPRLIRCEGALTPMHPSIQMPLQVIPNTIIQTAVQEEVMAHTVTAKCSPRIQEPR